MTTLRTLRQLAQAAKASVDSDDDEFMQALDDLSDALPPDVILRLIACVEAADAMRKMGALDAMWSESGRLESYDRARAALDAGKEE